MRLNRGLLAAYLWRHVAGVTGTGSAEGGHNLLPACLWLTWLPVYGRASWAPCVSLAQQAGLAGDARLPGGASVGRLC